MPGNRPLGHAVQNRGARLLKSSPLADVDPGVIGGDLYTLAKKLRESPEVTLYRGSRNSDRLPVVLKASTASTRA